MLADGSVFERRREALRASMREAGLTAVVAFGLPSFAPLCATHSCIRHLVGWSSRSGPSMLVQPADGDTTLIVPSALNAMYVAESFPWVARCLSESPASYGKAARRVLEGLGGGRVGLVGLSEMPQPVYQGLVGGDAARFSPAEHLVDALRLVKEEVEIACHREASRISDRMLGTLVERLRGFHGPAWQLVVDMEYAGRSLGAELALSWLSVGQPADRLRFVRDELSREVRDGDQVLVGTYVMYEGYWGHCLRMGSVGEPSDQYRRYHRVALESQRAGVRQLRAGGDARLVASESERTAEELLAGSTRHAARFRYAHFVGLEYAEPPTSRTFPQPEAWSQGAGAAEETVLQPGMVLEVHPNVGLPGAGFGVMGDQYVVREGEPERLTEFPQELFVV